jgi:alpha-glucosidase
MSDIRSATLYEAIGKIEQMHSDENGIHVTAGNAIAQIRFYSESIVRVFISRGTDRNPSYSVLAKPDHIAFRLSENAEELWLESSALKVCIRKKPLRINFLDNEGRILNEDDPEFGSGWIGSQVHTFKKLQQNERFIGLGEKTGPLDRKGHGYQNWNTDAYAYHAGTDPLYCSIPFYIGIHHELCYGIFFDNSFKSYFNFGASNNRFASFYADEGPMDYYFIYGPTVADILKQYTWLTGRTPLPPLWSLGYQQCRYSYYPETEVMAIARTFREKNIPADAIVLDIHYMDGYKIFTWDSQRFPDPGGVVRRLKELGFHTVLMCDPGIKVESGYAPYEEGKAEDVFLKYPDGSYYSGQVWPGWCHFPDFSRPSARQWWKKFLKLYTDLGVSGFWNDMNEIATWGNMLPELIECSFDGNKTTMREGRNVYGMLMARSTYEAACDLTGVRPFNLTRAGFAGVQRYAAVWTGDNVAYDEHMLLGVRLVNSLGLSGVPFAGYDIGGFVGNPDTRLFTRWLTIGSFSPFFRGHTMINSRDAEPWTFGEEAEQICRNYIRFRYRIMPYIYSAFYEAAETGMPVQRSLAIHYTHDPKIYETNYQNEYLFGPYLLIAPVESARDIAKIYLPSGKWYYLHGGTLYNGNAEHLIECPLHKLPVFVKAGAMIPMQQPGSHTGVISDILELHVYAGDEPSTFIFYQDDGRTFAYRDGQFYRRSIQYLPAEKQLILGEKEGTFRPVFHHWKIVFHGLQENVSFRLNKELLKASSENIHFFDKLEKYDPINEPEPVAEEMVVTFLIPETEKSFTISW